MCYQAKVLLKRSKRKDLYAILGVTPDASDAEIKSAYRKVGLHLIRCCLGFPHSVFVIGGTPIPS